MKAPCRRRTPNGEQRRASPSHRFHSSTDSRRLRDALLFPHRVPPRPLRDALLYPLSLQHNCGSASLLSMRTLVVGRGAMSPRSSVKDLGQPETMDWRRANKPDYVTPLEDSLTKYPSLRGQFEDVFVERMGVNAHPPPGVTSTGLTPAGVNAARDLLRPRGMLRILQEPTAGQSLSQLESDLRIMLSSEFIIVNVQQHTDPKSGVVHLLVAARKK